MYGIEAKVGCKKTCNQQKSFSRLGSSAPAYVSLKVTKLISGVLTLPSPVVYSSQEAVRTIAEETSMESSTPIRTIGPTATPADTRLWQSVHDYLDNPPPLAVLLRNPWKWLNSRTHKNT